MAVAKEQGVVLLTDDLAAREAATDAGTEVRGSISVIALGCGRGLLDRDEAASRMRALQRETSLFVIIGTGVAKSGVRTGFRKSPWSLSGCGDFGAIPPPSSDPIEH